MDIPTTFELMSSILSKAQPADEQILFLVRDNKKYINMLKKKVGDGKLDILQISFEAGKLVGINDKIKTLV